MPRPHACTLLSQQHNTLTYERRRMSVDTDVWEEEKYMYIYIYLHAYIRRKNWLDLLLHPVPWSSSIQREEGYIRAL